MQSDTSLSCAPPFCINSVPLPSALSAVCGFAERLALSPRAFCVPYVFAPARANHTLSGQAVAVASSLFDMWQLVKGASEWCRFTRDRLRAAGGLAMPAAALTTDELKSE